MFCFFNTWVKYSRCGFVLLLLFSFMLERKNILNPSTEFEPCPKPLWKHVHKSQTRGPFMSQIRSTWHSELMSKATSKVNQPGRAPPCLIWELPGNGECPKTRDSDSRSPHTPWIYIWASNTLLSSELPYSAPTSIPTLTLKHFYDTLAKLGDLFFHYKKGLQIALQKIRKWFVAIWPETEARKLQIR